MKRGVAIFGASGLIGSSLARHFVSKAEISELVLIDKEPLPPDLSSCECVRFVSTDLFANWDESVVVDSLSNAETVYFKVGMLGDPARSSNRQDALRYVQINVEIFLRLIAVLRRTSVHKVIIDSSIAAVAQPAQQAAISEDAPTSGAMNYYGMSKIILEDLALFFHRQSGIKVYIFRYPRVHAPSSPDVIWHFVRSVIREQPIIIKGDPDKLLDFVHLDDVIEANARAIHMESDWEVFHVTGNSPVTVRSLAQKVIALTGRDDHQIIFDDKSPVPIEPLRSSLSMQRTLRTLPLKKPKDIDSMIAETYDLVRASHGN